MKSSTSRLALIALLTVVSLYFVLNPRFYVKGTDLGGGTILYYQVDPQSGQVPTQADMQQLTTILKQRLDPSGTKNFVVRSQGSNRVEIILPREASEQKEAAKRLISTQGDLKFKIVASTNHPAMKFLFQDAERAWPKKDVGTEGTFYVYGKWVPMLKTVERNQETVTQAEKAWPTRKVAEGIYWVPARRLDSRMDDDAVSKFAIKREGTTDYVLAKWLDDAKIPRDAFTKLDEATGEHYVLMYNDAFKVTGEYLTRTDVTNERGLGVNFRFNGIGGSKFFSLTSMFKPVGNYMYHLGMILDNRVRSTPSLNDVISDSGVIHLYDSTYEEAKEYESILNGGRLPVTLMKEPVSQFDIDPTLGTDAINRAGFAMIVAVALIFLFMLWYYRFLGVVAIITLILNLLFTIALMNICRSTWTLPGLAALVLTIGMAVDANVLIFERMREEQEAGAGRTATIRAGFEKAWSCILDANVTSVITAIILFAIGTEAVKGFAITMVIGLVVNLFTAVYVARAILDWCDDQNLPKHFSMNQFLSKTNIDFLSIRKTCYAISLALIVLGVATMLIRGKNNFDIDFTGGTMVGLRTNKPLPIAEVRSLAEKVADNVSVESLNLSGEPQGQRYLIRVAGGDVEKTGQGGSIRQKMTQTFRDYLAIPKLTISNRSKIDVKPEAGKTNELVAFQNGEQAKLAFSIPVSESKVKNYIESAVKEVSPSEKDVDGQFRLTPIMSSQSVGTTGDTLYTEFDLISKATDGKAFFDAVTKSVETSTDHFDLFTEFGPQMAVETQQWALIAIILSWVAIIAYVGFRFDSWTFGAAGVVALVHDVLVAAGVTAIVASIAVALPALSFLLITDMKMDMNAIAALLTLTGYSINDTIVIFDRIRELRGRGKVTSDLVNRALNETLGRTIITSGLTLMSVVALFIGGGASLRCFTFILVIGFITGCYSTIYIASPLVVSITDWLERRAESAKRKPQPLKPAPAGK